MKKLIIILTVLIAMTIKTNAQAPAWLWANTMVGISNDYINDITHDASGNVYTTGYFSGTVDFDPGSGIYNLNSAGNYDIFISKFDESGQLVWAISLGGADSEFGVSIAIDKSGNIITTGDFNGTVDVDPDTVTNFTLTSNGIYDIFVLKLDESGHFIWANKMGGLNTDYSYAIAVDAFNNVYTTGLFAGIVDFDPNSSASYTLTADGTNDVFISKLDSMGNFVFAKKIGGPGNAEVGKALVLDSLGNIYTTGLFSGTSDFDPGTGTYPLTAAGNFDIFISKLDDSGNFIWAKKMGGTNLDYVYSIAVDASGNVYTTGSFFGTADFDPDSMGTVLITSPSTMSDIFISKLNSAGNYEWIKQIGSSDGDCAYDIALDVAGNIYTTGYFGGTVDFDPEGGVSYLTGVPGSVDGFISKLDPTGNFLWAKKMGGTSYDQGQCIGIDASNNIYLGGNFRSPFISFDTLTLSSADTNSLIVWDIFIAKLDTVSSSGNLVTEYFNQEFVIYPNPASDRVSFIFDNDNTSDLTMNIYSIMGELVRSEILEQNQRQINLGNLSNGVYLVVIKSKDGSKKQKLIIQR